MPAAIQPDRVGEQSVARRTVLTLALAVTAGTILGIPTAASPAPAMAATPKKWASKLKYAGETGGLVKTHSNAYTMTSIGGTTNLTTKQGAVRVAMTLTGRSNQLQIIDPLRGKLEKVVNLPDQALARGLAWDPRQRTLYIGIVGGILYSYKYDTGKLKSLGRVNSTATSLYGLAPDSKGRIWGGSYPLGIVWNYNPRTGKFSSLKRINAKADYVRSLAITSDDTIYVGTGTTPKVVKFHADSPNRRTTLNLPQLPKVGFVNKIEAHRDLVLIGADTVPTQLIWNHKTKKLSIAKKAKAQRQSAGTKTAKTNYWVNSKNLYATSTTTGKDTLLGPVPVTYPSHLIALNGSIYILERTGAQLVTHRFNLKTKKTTVQSTLTLKGAGVQVHSLLAGHDNKLYIGGYMGHGVATLDTKTGKKWQSLDTVAPNQIEGMIRWNNTKTFIGSYGSSDIIRMSSNQVAQGASAFKRMERLSTKYHQSRPFGWAKNSTQVFFGTVPDYGRSGGALGIINPATDKVEAVYNNIIPGHSIVGLAADNRYVYGTTSTRNGYGIADTKGWSRVFKFDLKTRKLVWNKPITGYRGVYSPVLHDGKIVAGTVAGLVVISASSGAVERKFEFTGRQDKYQRPAWNLACVARIGNGHRFVHSGPGTVFVADVLNGTLRKVKGASDTGTAMAVMPDGRIFTSYRKLGLAQLKA